MSQFSWYVNSPFCAIYIIDINWTLYDLFWSGFENAQVGCCGTGRFEMGFMCDPKSPFTCTDANKYVFWDAFHPSEKTSQIVSNYLMENYLGKFLWFNTRANGSFQFYRELHTSVNVIICVINKVYWSEYKDIQNPLQKFYHMNFYSLVLLEEFHTLCKSMTRDYSTNLEVAT